MQSDVFNHFWFRAFTICQNWPAGSMSHQTECERSTRFSPNWYQVANAMTTAMGRKTSLANKHLPNCHYFAIIPSLSQRMLRTQPLDWSYMHKIKQLGLYVNAAISRCCFAEEDKGLFVSACRTCSTLFFPLSTIKILYLFCCRFGRWC